VTGVQDLLQLKRVVTGVLLITVVLKTVTVKHGKIAGYTEAVPATYELDDTLVNKLRPGDDIKATVHEGEHRLRNVRIVHRAPSRLSAPAKP
jgi:hypothetical protein